MYAPAPSPSKAQIYPLDLLGPAAVQRLRSQAIYAQAYANFPLPSQGMSRG
ncbi:hypothetical protein HMPREF3198_00849 [Winkia neuii]|nr:hypothetical protein HMPREF3198_00849 [Winkia neuii]